MQKSPRNILWFFLSIVSIVIFIVIYIVFDRDFARDAYLYAHFSKVSSNESGEVTQTFIHDGDRIKAGDKLFTINCQPYLLKLSTIKANILQKQTQIIDLTAEKSLAITLSNTQKEKLSVQQQRLKSYQRLKAGNDISQDNFNTQYQAFLSQKLDTIKAQQAIANLTTTINLLKSDIQNLETTKNTIEYHINQCTIIAKTTGIVTNFHLQTGDYINQGLPLFSIVNPNEWFVIANVKESNLSNVKVGDKVKITTSVTGESILSGTVMFKEVGINRPEYNQFSAFTKTNANIDWIKFDQRFPVIIKLDASKYNNHFKLGADAHVWF
ncbi:HlyD family secretion protein [Cysteiniphilum halobium]|uniref:HlyD family secretion protein n=1 Tax=Cysteiniphilum halobium TaxID=2219059 RepID=UPI000E65928E|nr:HlyD family efflux transporter periplasmic adaptor subunit [Cysteiniphilum halobium]